MYEKRKRNHQKFRTGSAPWVYKMELQISHSIWAEVETEGVFQRKTPGNTRNIKTIMSMERSRDHRGRGMSGSHTHAGKPPAQNKRVRLYGVFERKKCVVNLSKKKSALIIYQRKKSALLIYQKWGNMKFAYKNRAFWCKDIT